MNYTLSDGRVFQCEPNGIPGFCGGVQYWDFRIYPDEARGGEGVLTTSVQDLFEKLLLDAGTCVVTFADTVDGVVGQLFKDVTDGEIAGNIRYTVTRSAPVFNWNSGNECVIITAYITDLSGERYENPEDGNMPCGCCECCGCSCDGDDE